MEYAASSDPGFITRPDRLLTRLHAWWSRLHYEETVQFLLRLRRPFFSVWRVLSGFCDLELATRGMFAGPRDEALIVTASVYLIDCGNNVARGKVRHDFGTMAWLLEPLGMGGPAPLWCNPALLVSITSR